MEPKEKRAFEPTGLVPRSIVRTFERFRQQLLPGSEGAAIREYRISRYQVLVSTRCLFTLLTIPIATNWFVSSWLLSPIIEHFWNTQQNELFLNAYQEERAFTEMESFSEKLFFESLLVNDNEQGLKKTIDNHLQDLNYPMGEHAESVEKGTKLPISFKLPLQSLDPLTLLAREGGSVPSSPLPQDSLQSDADTNGYVGDKIQGKGLNLSLELSSLLVPEESKWSFISSDNAINLAPVCHDSPIGTGERNNDKLSGNVYGVYKAPVEWGAKPNALQSTDLPAAAPQALLRVWNQRAYLSTPVLTDMERMWSPCGMSTSSCEANGGLTKTLQPTKTRTLIAKIDGASLQPLHLSTLVDWNASTAKPQATYSVNGCGMSWLELPSGSTREARVQSQQLLIKQKVQDKILELAVYYNQQTISSITNVAGDLVSALTLACLFVWMKPEISILKSFLVEAIYSLSDTTKSFLLILLTDLLVGFHSPRGWETALEVLLKHFGLPENQDFVFLFVATFPVLLDTVFKYWIFRHLNKISPSTVATYHSMIE